MYYYCSILLQHVLSLIYIHPWHHICLLRITYPDLSLFYFPVTWLFKWSCGFSGVSSLFALIYILWRLTGTFTALGIYGSMLYQLATDCLSESNDVGVFRGGASVGVGGLEPPPPTPRTPLEPPQAPLQIWGGRKREWEAGGGKRTGEPP